MLKTRSRLYELRAFKNVTINTSAYNIKSDNSVPSSKILSHAVDDITTKIDNKYDALKTKIDDNKTNISKTNSSVQTNRKHINFLEHCCFPVDLYNKEIEYFAGMSDLLNANGVGNTAFIDSEFDPLTGEKYDAMQYDQFGYKISIFRGRKDSEWIHETWNSNGNTFENGYLRVTPGIILLDAAFFIRVQRYDESNEALELICHQGGGNLEAFLSNYNIELTVGRDPHSPKGHTGFVFKNNSKCNFVIMERFKLWN